MRKKSLRIATIWGMITVLLIGTASWALYGLINKGTEDLLLRFKITNEYMQLSLVVLFVIILLSLTGVGFYNTIKKITN